MKLTIKATKVRKWWNRANRWLRRTFGWDRTIPFDALPDLPLLTIFDHIPLAQLMDLRTVSQRWNTLALAACKTRSNLVLLIGDGAEANFRIFFEETTFDSLTSNALLKKGTDYFLEHFTHISSLTVVLCEATEGQIAQLVRLVNLWAGRLIKLNIFIKYNPAAVTFNPMTEQPDDAIRAQLLHLFVAINSSPSLKQLQIRLFSFILPRYTDENLDLSILCRLEKCTFSSFDRGNILVDSLLAFTRENPHLALLDLGNILFKKSAIRLLQLQPRIAQLFKTLSLAIWWLPRENQLSRFVEHFCNLSTLGLRLDGSLIPLPILSRILRSLKNLNHLSVYVTDLPAHLVAVEGEILEELPSVHYFSFSLLDWPFADHDELGLLNLHQMVPNIRKMDVGGTWHACDVCGDFGPSDGRKGRPNDWYRVEQCIGQMVEPIRELFPASTRFSVCTY